MSDMAITRTPFRISFLGGGSDYPEHFCEHGGATLSMSIDKYCWVMARWLPPFYRVRHRIVWSHLETVEEADEILHPTVRAAFLRLGVDGWERGVEIHHWSDLPARSGLGSSSSFAVGLLHALERLAGFGPPKYPRINARSLADQAIDLERNDMAEPGGWQDQIAAAYGRLRLTTYSRCGYQALVVPHTPARRADFCSRLVLVYTGTSRRSYALSAAMREIVPLRTSELCKLANMAHDAGSMIRDGDWDGFAEAVDEGWHTKHELMSAISSTDIDSMYEAGIAGGAKGGKLLGSGGRGFLLFVGEPDLRERLAHVFDLSQMVSVFMDFGGSTWVKT